MKKKKSVETTKEKSKQEETKFEKLETLLSSKMQLSTSAKFDSLCDEKKRLLRRTNNQQAKQTSADREQRHQLRQQMNSVNKRLHAVVQHMSAFDRYKRKKRFSTAEPRATTKHAAHVSPSPTPASQTAENIMSLNIPSRNIVDLDVFKPLRDLANQTVNVGKKFAEILQNECKETRLQQLAELEQNDAGSIWSTTVDHVKQCTQLEIQLDREAEEARIREERRDKDRREAEDRLRRDQREKERQLAQEFVRLQPGQRENERQQAAEQVRLQREQREKDRQLAAEHVRLERERREKDRQLAAEQRRLQREQREKERQLAAEQVRLEREQREKERRQAQVQAEEEARLQQEQVEREAEEQYQRQREQRAKERREADEQDRLQVERAERENEERLQKKLARIQLHLVKTEADCQCRLAWLERFPLVTHRRANQTANAG